MSNPGRCPSCRGSGYLWDSARGIKFVCTNCEGHPHPADTPAMYREPIGSVMRRAFEQQRESNS